MKKIYTKTFSEFCRKCMKNKNITTKDIAAITNCDEIDINHIINGNDEMVNVPPIELGKITQFLFTNNPRETKELLNLIDERA